MLGLELDGFSADDITAMVTDMLRVNERAVEFTAIEAWGNVKKESPINEGLLAGSWQLTKSAPLEWRIHTGVHYALFVHEGTRAGVARPFAPIADWAGRKGLPPWGVWQNIRKYGTKANPYADRAIDATERRTGEFIRKAMAEMGGGS